MTPFRIGRGRQTPGKRTYLVALTVDCVGNGLWTPVALIFFTRGSTSPWRTSVPR